MLISDALPRLGADVLMISIDGDPNEDAQMLRRYADDLGFTWRFAVAPRELMSALSRSYGDVVLYPPSDPMFVVSAKGVPHRLPSGTKDEDVLRQAVERYRDE